MTRKTKVFQKGNSQAIRIPADSAFEQSDIEAGSKPIGDALPLRPAPRRLTRVLKKFARFGKDFKLDGERGAEEQAEREAL